MPPANSTALDVVRPTEQHIVSEANHILEPWQREFARWLASGRRHRKADQLAKLFDLTGTTWTYPRMKVLLDSGLFREYVGVMRERGLRAAKERIGEVAYDAVEGLAEGIAHTRGEKDYATMSKLTGQVLERAMPRRDDLTQQRLVINIGLSPKQQALEEQAPLAITAEPVD